MKTIILENKSMLAEFDIARGTITRLFNNKGLRNSFE
jgi:hypothetical protein